MIEALRVLDTREEPANGEDTPLRLDPGALAPPVRPDAPSCLHPADAQ